jgi:phosphoribosylformylglycinamidine synthase
LKRSEIGVLLFRAPGTNCDRETAIAFRSLGVRVDVFHTQKIFREKNLHEYDIIVFPGGFSYGDYVRSGAIWAKECEYKIGPELEEFISNGKPVIGICNGFQLLVEAGFLPAFRGRSKYPQAALANNIRGYQCRWIRMKNVNNGNCSLTRHIPRNTVIRLPIAHGEGRFVFPKESEQEFLEKLNENDQLVFRYVKEDGSFPEMKLWHNPNGSWHDIAGICNPEGNVLGLMPHPERAFFGWQTPYWTQEESVDTGEGRIFFESIIKYVEIKF